MELGAAFAELDALLGHLVLVLLAHGAAQQIGAAERVAGHDLGRLHDLLLVDEHAVRFLRHAIEQLVRRLDFRQAFLALHVIGYQVHRAGPIEGDERVQVFDVPDVELPRPAGHATGFQLEDGDRLAFVEEVEGRLVFERDAVDIEIRGVAVD